MQTIIRQSGEEKITELVGQDVFLATPQDALDIVANQKTASRKIILHKENIAPNFFDLSSGVAGEILQKMVNYKIRLAIVGDFSKETSDSLKAFIAESNRGRHVCFADSSEKAMEHLVHS